MNISEQWGLPPDFEPVRFAVPDEVKDVMREVLAAGEPVIVSVTNRPGTQTMIATPHRFFTVKGGGSLGGVGAVGCTVKEYPWEGIDRLVEQQAADILRFAIHYRTHDGRTVEIGRRAKLGKDAVDHLGPFEHEKGQSAFEAIHTIWEARGEQ